MKYPFDWGSVKPSRSLICEVSTCIAAPDTKPDTKLSDSKNDIMPSRRMYIINWIIPTKKQTTAATCSGDRPISPSVSSTVVTFNGIWRIVCGSEWDKTVFPTIIETTAKVP